MKGALLVAVLLYISLPRTLADGSMRIPRILHRNFMGGAKALREATRDPRSGFKAHWLDSCRVSCCCYCCCGPLKAAAGYTPQYSLQAAQKLHLLSYTAVIHQWLHEAQHVAAVTAVIQHSSGPQHSSRTRRQQA
jgi:hypothetical protein